MELVRRAKKQLSSLEHCGNLFAENVLYVLKCMFMETGVMAIDNMGWVEKL
jgi:hypothetical protein